MLIHIKTNRLLLIALFCSITVLPSWAQTSGAQGDLGRASVSAPPASYPKNFSYFTSPQQPSATPTTVARLTPRIGAQSKNGLPPCQMDSFVYSAGGMADLIYGDEGTDGPPPYSSFTAIHRIEAGIFGDTRKGLTTGHGSNLPSAWGNDEFLGAEWAQPAQGPGTSSHYGN